MIKLLLVEDDEHMRFIIEDGLMFMVGEYNVRTAVDGIQGIKLWKEFHPDIIITDVDMPNVNGYKMVEYIRERDKHIPILFISGLKSSHDVAKGYNAGGNNYIKKPFGPEELHAHIQGLLKIKSGLSMRKESNLIKFGAFTLNVNSGLLLFEDNKRIRLTNREVPILIELAKNKGEVVRRSIFLEKFWDDDSFFASRCLDVMLSKLRKKLKVDPNVKIETVKGLGIKLIDCAIPDDL